MDYKDDITYIEQILKGKINAFSYIVDHHKDNAYNLAFRISGNAEDAEEIAQDSFMKAYRSLKDFRKKSSFSTWLYRIVYNTAISHVRLKKKGILSLEDFPAETKDFLVNNTTEEEAEKEYRNSLINFALQKINEEERALISLFYFDELSVEEIAEIAIQTKSNIKVRLFRARMKMLEVIEKTDKKKIYIS